jgi:hypothetical protein
MNPLTPEQEIEIARIVRENYKGQWPAKKVAKLYGITMSDLQRIITNNPQPIRKETIMPKLDAPKTEAPKKEKAPKEPKVKRLSYQDKIRTAMTENKGVISRANLMEATGADAKNLAVAVSILKNPKRQKEPMVVQYIRKLETYYNMDSDAGAKAHAAAIQKMADDDAAAKAADKKAKAEKKAQDKANAAKLAEEKSKSAKK